MPNWEEDDDCTAVIGVGGEEACHQYPGCGCFYTGEPEQELVCLCGSRDVTIVFGASVPTVKCNQCKRTRSL